MLNSDFSKLLKILAMNAVIAGAYFLIGLLSLLADPLGILMLPTGLGLAAVLLLGYRILPGIVVGSFCVSAWSFNVTETYLAIYVATAIGTSWGVAIGAALIRKMVGFPNPLVDGKSIALFMFLGGPIGCIFPASFIVLVMRYLEIIATSDVIVVGLNFYLGNILGVLLCAPIILIFFAQPQHLWLRRKITVGLPMLVTFSLVMALFIYLKEIDKQLYTEQLKDKANTLAEVFKRSIDIDLYPLYGLKNYLLAAPDIKSETFANLAKQMLSPLQEVQALLGLEINNQTIDNKSFITIYDRRLLSNSSERRPVDYVWLTKRMAQMPDANAAKIFFSNQRKGYLVVPINANLAEVKNSHRFLVALIAMEILLERTLTFEIIKCCTVTLTTPKDTMQESMSFSYGNGMTGLPYQTIPINVLGQAWHLDFYQNVTNVSSAAHWPFSWIMFLGLYFTGLLGSVLLYLTGRYFRTEAIIEDRAKALTEMKMTAEQANQAKNHFLAKISHELRTPLNGILGFTQLLEKRPAIDSEEKKLIAIIKQCSDSLLKLINDILDISAIESKQTKIEISSFNFQDLIQECVNICKIKADQKGLEFVVKNNCVEQSYFGDEKRIRQIIANLLDNAVKYTNRGRITVISRYEEGYLKVTVEDTGCGIKPNDLEQIFKPFTQVNVHNFSQEGIGLGLAISKELVGLMHGELMVKSYHGIGSAFTFVLPLQVNAKKTAKLPDNLQRHYQKYSNTKVLVVDDNKINLLFMAGMVNHIGCFAHSAKDGFEALVLVEKNNYDIALIDINMPIIDGFELAKKIKQQNHQFPLVAVTAYADQDKINEAKAAGFDFYLTKPVEEAQLIKLIGICCGGEQISENAGTYALLKGLGH